jgi:hypothetical protein
VTRFLMLIFALIAMSSETLANLDLFGGSPPGCC